jgi:hypothetical protein
MIFKELEMLRPLQDVLLGGLVIDLDNRRWFPTFMLRYEDVI